MSDFTTRITITRHIIHGNDCVLIEKMGLITPTPGAQPLEQREFVWLAGHEFRWLIQTIKEDKFPAVQSFSTTSPKKAESPSQPTKKKRGECPSTTQDS